MTETEEEFIELVSVASVIYNTLLSQGFIISKVRPIEEAPKDGTPMLLLFEGDWYKGYWYTHPSVSGWITSEYNCNDYEFEPTHFMDLPSLPNKDGTPMGVDIIQLKETCNECPEQYDAYLGGKQVGYLRMRHGHFSVTCPDVKGIIVYQGSPNGDGCFDDEERDYYLRFAVKAILDWIEHGVPKQAPAPTVDYKIVKQGGGE